MKLIPGLRYVYIIHKTWLEKKFPDNKKICIWLISLLLTLFLLCFGLNLFVCVLCGWPNQKIFEMPFPQTAICVTSLLGTLSLLNGLSCFFYALILRERGRFGNNKVTNLEDPSSMDDIWMGENRSVIQTLSVPALIQVQ